MVAAYPALIRALYRRDRSLLAGMFLFDLVNLIVFPSPEDDEAWATRVVLSERAWLKRGIGSSPVDAAFVALATPIYLCTLWAAVRGRSIQTGLGALFLLAVMLPFFERMARLYDRRAA